MMTPKGWTTAVLGELCQPKQWPILSKSDMSTAGFPVYGANGIIGYSHTRTHSRPVLLVGCRGTCGSVHVAPADSYANGNAMALDQLSDRVDLRFLATWLRYRGFRDVTTGTSQPQITRQGIVKVDVPLPSIEEQRRIADILDRADALRAKRRETLAHLHALTQSFFVGMFGDPISNPRRFPVNAIGNLGQVVTGGTPPSASDGMFGGSTPFVTPGDLNDDLKVKRSLTERGAGLVGTVRPGATLVCCIGATIGKVGRARTRSAFNQQINAIEWNHEIDDHYGYMSMRWRRDVISGLGSSTTLPILSKSRFARIAIPVPPIELQRQYSKRSLEIVGMSSSGRAGLSLLDQLFESLEAEAFAGGL